MKIVRLDTSKIAVLNRPDDDEPEPEPEPPKKQQQQQQHQHQHHQEQPRQTASDPECCVCRKTTKGTKSFRMEGKRFHVVCFRCAACDCLLDPADFYQDTAGDAVCADCNI
jgi:hypothetical protein